MTNEKPEDYMLTEKEDFEVFVGYVLSHVCRKCFTQGKYYHNPFNHQIYCRECEARLV